MKLEVNYLIYDGRFRTNPDIAILYECCSTLKEARKNKNDYGNDTVIVKAKMNSESIVSQRIIL